MIVNMIFEEGEDPCPSLSWGRDPPDEQILESLEKTVSYAESCGYEIEFGNNVRTMFSSKDKTITINTRYNKKNMLYSLLHELGHMTLHEELQNGEFGWNYPYYANKKMQPQKEYTKRWMFGLVHEEFDAWRKGLDLAAMLELNLDAHDYVQYSTKMLGTYISAAAEYI